MTTDLFATELFSDVQIRNDAGHVVGTSLVAGVGVGGCHLVRTLAPVQPVQQRL